MYGKSPTELTETEKQALIQVIKGVAGVAGGAAAGSDTAAGTLATVSAGMTVAENAVENNLLLVDYSGLKGLTKTETEKHRKTMQLLKDNGIENIDDAREILNSNPKILPDNRGKEGFYRYESSGLEMIYNPKTKEIWHIQPMK